MEKLFSAFKLGRVKIPNRIIRAAMWEPYCPGGVISEEFIKVHEEHIEGGCGMTTTGFVTTDPVGSIHPNQLDMTKNELSDLQDFTTRIHDLDGTVSVNLSYCGPAEGLFQPERWFVLDYSEDQLNEVKESFATSASVSVDAGFDAIEVHHFILSEFFHEQFNKRDDQYGGSLENRARFPIEIIESVRAVVPDDFPIIAKFTVHPGLLSNEDMVYNALALESAGVDALVVWQMFDVSDPKQLYVLEDAKLIQEHLDIPVIYCGGVQDGDSLIEVMENEFELVQIGRALLKDPQLPYKVLAGEDPELCAKCDGCHTLLWEENKIGCRWSIAP